MLFRSTYPDIKNIRSELWYVSSSGIVYYTVPESIRDQLPTIREYLLLSKNETVCDRKNLKRKALRLYVEGRKKPAWNIAYN